jgi:hypothetical protein
MTTAAREPRSEASDSAAEVARLREALRRLIDLSPLSRREVERRLAALGGGVNLTHLLAGDCELKVRHVLDVVEVLDMHPFEFFALTLGEPRRPSELLRRIQAAFPLRRRLRGARATDHDPPQPAAAQESQPRASAATVVRMGETLRSLIRLSPLSQCDIEKRLAAGGRGIGLTRLLAGKQELKLRHVLDILRLLGLHPYEFVGLTLRKPQRPSPLLERVESVFYLSVPTRDLDELRRAVATLQGEVERLSAAVAGLGEAGPALAPSAKAKAQPEP